MLSGGANVVGDQVVVGDLVPLFGMVPEPAHVLDELAFVVDQGIVEGNDPTVRIAGGGISLELGQTSLVKRLNVPGNLVDPAIQAGWIGGEGKLGVDPGDGLALGDQKPRQVLGKVPALRLVLEQIAVAGKRFLDNRRPLDDGRQQTPPFVGGSPLQSLN